MIVFDLECLPAAHRFEGWFASSDEFVRQQERGLIACPTCGSVDVVKAVMAPNIGRKGNQLPDRSRRRDESSDCAAPDNADADNAEADKAVAAPATRQPAPALPPQAAALLRAIASAQAEALKSSHWVGEDFAENARAMHYGEKDHAPIHGQATVDEARELREEGIDIAPVLFPIVPPGEAN